jgi:hypothetical protein
VNVSPKAARKLQTLDEHELSIGLLPPAPSITIPIAEFLGDEDAADALDELLVGKLLPVGVVAFLAGLPKTLKTWLLILIGLCVASGRRLFDRYSCKQGSVLIVTEEDTVKQIRRRLWWLARGLGLDPRTLPIRISALHGFRIDDEKHLAQLEDEAKGAALIGLDALTRVHGLDENSRTDMQVVTHALQGLAARTGATVLTIHHMRKRHPLAGDAERPGQRMRGTGDLHALARAVIAASKRDDGAIELCGESNYADDVEPFAVQFHIEPAVDKPLEPGQKRRAWFEYVGEAKDADDKRADDAVLAAFTSAREPVSVRELRGLVELDDHATDGARKRLAQAGAITPIRYRPAGNRQASDRWVLASRRGDFEATE